MKRKVKMKGMGHHTFNPMGGSFPTISEFADRNYSPLRFAFETCQRDDKGLETLMGEMVPQGIVPALLESWCEQKRLLEAYIKLLNAASTRF
jgi:hypothetical protein